MKNHFKTAWNDSKFQEKYKDKPFHKALLYSFMKFYEKGYTLHDLPWFPMANKKKKGE